MRYLYALIAAAFILAFSGSAVAQGVGVEAGVRVGGNWSLLSQPRDLEGEPTLLNGTAFDGFGWEVGVTGLYPFYPVSFGDAFVLVDILYAHHGGTGFAENPNNSQKRTVKIETSMVRVPALIGVAYDLDTVGFRLMVGPELVLGFSASSTVEEENIPGTPTPLLTTPVTHVAIDGGVGLDYTVGQWTFPLDVRLAFDPFVPNKTVERFEGFQSMDDPGDYQVAFDWTLMFMVGVTRGF